MAYIPPSDWELKDFFRDHADAVYRGCCFLTCGRADALAMTGEIFHRIITRGMEFRSEREARAWMLLTAYKLGRKLPKDAPRPELSIPLDRLSRKNRLVAMLYYCEGYRKKEIADLLGCPEFWIRWRLARVKRRLASRTDPEEPEDLEEEEIFVEEPSREEDIFVEELPREEEPPVQEEITEEEDPEEAPSAPEPEEEGGALEC